MISTTSSSSSIHLFLITHPCNPPAKQNVSTKRENCERAGMPESNRTHWLNTNPKAASPERKLLLAAMHSYFDTRWLSMHRTRLKSMAPSTNRADERTRALRPRESRVPIYSHIASEPTAAVTSIWIQSCPQSANRNVCLGHRSD